MLAANADILVRNRDGATALHTAASYGHSDVVKTLLDHGADLAARDNANQTAADLARLLGHDEILHYLETRAVTASGIKEIDSSVKSLVPGIQTMSVVQQNS